MVTTYILNGEIVDKETIDIHLSINPNDVGYEFEIKEELIRKVKVFGEECMESADDLVESIYCAGQDIVLDESDYCGENIRTFKGEIKLYDKKKID